jgi:hypothetical protein
MEKSEQKEGETVTDRGSKPMEEQGKKAPNGGEDNLLIMSHEVRQE